MTVGTSPGSGPALTDGVWLQGLANGQNQSYVSGLTAKAGGNQSNGTLIPANSALVEFDTVASNGDSSVLPFAEFPGTEIVVINATSTSSLDVYSNPGTNPATGTADSVNGSTSVAATISAHSATRFYCAKAGVWISG